MEKAKRELKETFEKHVREGLPPEEALTKTIVESRQKHEESKFMEALKEFLKEVGESYSLKDIPEEDPLMALSDSIYLEYELLLPKIKSILKR